jgi:hypothetical protein
MGYPFTLQGVPQYLTKGEFIITQSGKTGSHPISFCLPMNTKYQEKAKFDLRNGKYTKLDIVFEATVYPGGKIVDGVWTPQGKGTRVGAYLWCPLEEIKVDTLYLDITAGYKL